ncbi:hypothetical protein ACFHWD_20470 [Clostridium sp. MT-14]|uniref:hypothetical protein n=1 Tax=Clostridium sp. MT-14 TaxID=3348360 RepID=UPI0035F43465
MNKRDEEFVKKYINNINVISENKTELYMILIPLILSKKLIKKRNQLQYFVEEVIITEFAKYAYNSRTILVGKLMKYINDLPIEEAVSVNERVVSFIKKLILENNEDSTNKEVKKKTKKMTHFFSDWDKVINDNSETDKK